MAITVTELAEWLEIPTTPALTAEKTALLQRCIDGAVAVIADRCALPAEPWSEDINLAHLLVAARLYKRRASPEGVAGFGELGVVRVTTFDPDVERLLGTYLNIGFA